MSRSHGRLAVAGLALAAILVACFSEHSEPETDNSALCSSAPGSTSRSGRAWRRGSKKR